MAMRNQRNKNHPPNTDLVQNYLESSWDIVTDVYKALGGLEQIIDAINAGTLDDFLSAEDIDTLTKLNNILTDAQLGPFSTQAQAEGGADNTTTMTPLRVAQAIAALANPFDNNLNGDGPPTASDDDTQGYGVNSIWMDTTADPDETYRCTDATTAAAVWIKTSLTADELSTVAISGNSDDLTEGATNLLLTAAERAKLLGVEDGATADQSGSDIALLLFAQPDTNNLTDALKTKLDNVENGATADQTAAEIVTAYNSLVAQINEAERNAGTEVAIRRYSPADVAYMAARHSGAMSPEIKTADFTAEAGKFYYVDATAGPIAITFPAGVNLAQIGVADVAHIAGTNNITCTPDGVETLDGDSVYIIDQDEADITAVYNASGTNWFVNATGTPEVVNLSDFVYKYRGQLVLTGNYTLTLADKGYLLIADSASDFVVTIPNNADVAFDTNTFFNMINKNTGNATFAEDTDTLSSTDNVCEGGNSASLIKIGLEQWWVTGGTTP